MFKQIRANGRTGRSRISAVLAKAPAAWSQRLRIAIVSGAAWASPVQSFGAGGQGACAPAENLRSAEQPGGKRLRAGGPGEDQTVFRSRAEPCLSLLSGAQA